MKTKICFRCKEEKEIDQFYKSKKDKDGYLGRCKACEKQRNRIVYKKHKRIIDKDEYYTKIKNIVCKITNTTASELDSKSRDGNIPTARIILAHVLWKNFGSGSDKSKPISLSDIGYIVRGNPDHSIVNYYLTQADNYKDSDLKFTTLLSIVEKSIIEETLDVLYSGLIYKIGDNVITYSESKEPVNVELLTYDFSKKWWICQHENKLICRGESMLVTILNR